MSSEGCGRADRKERRYPWPAHRGCYAGYLFFRSAGRDPLYLAAPQLVWGGSIRKRGNSALSQTVEPSCAFCGSRGWWREFWSHAFYQDFRFLSKNPVGFDGDNSARSGDVCLCLVSPVLFVVCGSDMVVGFLVRGARGGVVSTALLSAQSCTVVPHYCTVCTELFCFPRAILLFAVSPQPTFHFTAREDLHLRLNATALRRCFGCFYV